MIKFKFYAILMFITLFLTRVNQIYGYSPQQFDPKILSIAQKIPEEYLLFIPDTASQILFNPARAAKYTGKFIYGTYNNPYKRQSSLGPNTIIATLFGKEDSKWLLILGNGIHNSDNSMDNSMDNSNSENSYSYYRNSQINEMYNREDNENHSMTLIKLSHIWDSNNLGISLGLTGILNHNKSKFFSSSLSSRYQFYERSSLSSNYTTYQSQYSLEDRSYKSNGQFNDTDYALGLEFALSGSTWDWINWMGVQKSNNDANGYLNHYASDFDSIYATMLHPDSIINIRTRLRSQVNKTECLLKNKPAILSFKSTWQHQTGLITPDDHLFISLNGAYGFGKEEYNYYDERKLFWKYDGTIETNDTSAVAQNGDAETYFWKTTLSAGYLVNKKVQDLTVITGFHPDLSYIHEKGISEWKTSGRRTIPPNNEFYLDKSETLQASLNFPLILYYSPLKWLRLFGGFQYNYGYRVQKLKSEVPTVTQYTSNRDEIPLNDSITHHRETTSSSLNSSRMFHLGCTLKVMNKLIAHILFNDDIASTRMWNISLGYHF